MRLSGLKKAIIWVNLLFTVSFPAMAGMLDGFVDFYGQPAALDKIFPKERWIVVMIWSHTCPICAREISTHVK